MQKERHYTDSTQTLHRQHTDITQTAQIHGMFKIQHKHAKQENKQKQYTKI